MTRPFAILLLNGPNLNLLGAREPDHYGTATLHDIVTALDAQARSAGAQLSHLQTNAEHEAIERIHAAATDGTDGIIVNPAAWTHTSVALRDALAAIGRPFIEVHLSNVHAREPFRRHSYFSDCALGVIAGLGSYGYTAGLVALLEHLATHKTAPGED